MPQNNNPYTEVGIILVSVCLIAGGVVLLVLSKIDFTAATLMFTLAIGLYGVNSALKAPSSAQQQQLATIQQGQQQLTAQVLSVLPAVAATQSPPQPTPRTQPGDEFGVPVVPPPQ